MGASKSQFANVKNGFDEVATKCKWKQGLIVDVRNVGRFVVTSIRGLSVYAKVGSLRVEEHFDGQIYIYVYEGGQVISDGVYPAWEITLKPVEDAKIGGSSTFAEKLGAGGNSSESNDLTESSEDEPVDSNKEYDSMAHPAKKARDPSENGAADGVKPKTHNYHKSHKQSAPYSDITIDDEPPNFVRESKFTVKCRPCDDHNERNKSGSAEESIANGRAMSAILTDKDDNIADDDFYI